MSKNWVMGDVGAGVTIAAAVDAKAVAGDVTHVGTAAGGLYGYLVTERGTADGPNAVGIADGQASVRLIPTEAVVELTVAGSPTLGAKVYSSVGSSAVEYTTVGAAAKYHVGHVVTIPGRTAASGKAFVYLGSATGAVGGI